MKVLIDAIIVAIVVLAIGVIAVSMMIGIASHKE